MQSSPPRPDSHPPSPPGRMGWFSPAPLQGILSTVGTLAAGVGMISCTAIATPTDSTHPLDLIQPSPNITLTVSITASVQDVMQDIQRLYEQDTPHITLIYNAGSSGSLAQQIQHGAPTDIFLSASEQWMDELERQGLILDGSRQPLLVNQLALIVPQNDLRVTGLPSLLDAGIRSVAMGQPDSVPAGQYAKEALTSLNLFDALQSRLVFGKDVRQVLSYVETGNVDAGLVYASDAQRSPRVRIVERIPTSLHSPIVYPVGVVASSTTPDAAQAFVEFLSSEPAAAIFESYGFTLAD
jgi:molybdate transport system substrate-binding protein